VTLQVGVVRYGRLRRIAEFAPQADAALAPQRDCVVRTPRGLEVGHLLAVVDRERAPAGGALVRLASAVDQDRARELEARAEEDLRLARSATRDRGQLRVVGVERLLDGERAAVYYTAEGRIDVPAVEGALTEVLEVPQAVLEQVGARQRARLCGGAGVCGRSLCCSTFLRALTPVTMRMAKVQGLDLSPRATAGACGRLKCCLRYENPLYAEAGRGLPRRGWKVRTARGVRGVAREVDILRRRVLVLSESGRLVPVFAAEVVHTAPPPRTPLPIADEAPSAAEGASADPVDEGPEDASPEPEAGWSQLAKRLWRRVNPRSRRAEEPPEEED
jgi:cell fate regulator YaaT (PSP1 superfamily)